MAKFEYIITDNLGIHARPAGKLVKLAKSFNCNINIQSKGVDADLKKLFAVMGLGVKKEDTIIISCEGENETEAAAALEEFLKENL
jgi:phosphocarrier protein